MTGIRRTRVARFVTLAAMTSWTLAGCSQSDVQSAPRCQAPAQLPREGPDAPVKNEPSRRETKESDAEHMIVGAIASRTARFLAVPCPVPEVEGGATTVILERHGGRLLPVRAIKESYPLAWSPCREGVLLLRSAWDGDPFELYLVDLEHSDTTHNFRSYLPRRFYSVDHDAIQFIDWSSEDVLTLRSYKGRFLLELHDASTEAPQLKWPANTE